MTYRRSNSSASSSHREKTRSLFSARKMAMMASVVTGLGIAVYGVIPSSGGFDIFGSPAHAQANNVVSSAAQPQGFADMVERVKTLNIAGDYIAYGIRERASEIVTRELGQQTELEVTKQLEREVDADRFTRLDRMLIAEQQGRSFPTCAPTETCATPSARTAPC